MFTEKDIEQAKCIKNNFDNYVNKNFGGYPHPDIVFDFIFLKLAQLENENKRLSEMIENLNPDKYKCKHSIGGQEG